MNLARKLHYYKRPSTKPRWFNPTRNAYWDMYYAGMWLFWTGVILGILLDGVI